MQAGLLWRPVATGRPRHTRGCSQQPQMGRVGSSPPQTVPWQQLPVCHLSWPGTGCELSPLTTRSLLWPQMQALALTLTQQTVRAGGHFRRLSTDHLLFRPHTSTCQAQAWPSPHLSLRAQPSRLLPTLPGMALDSSGQLVRPL